MQQAIDVVEQVILGDDLARIGRLEMRQPFIGDGIAAACPIALWRGWCSGEQPTLRIIGKRFGFAVIQVAGEVLTVTLKLHIRKLVRHQNRESFTSADSADRYYSVGLIIRSISKYLG